MKTYVNKDIQSCLLLCYKVELKLLPAKDKQWLVSPFTTAAGVCYP